MELEKRRKYMKFNYNMLLPWNIFQELYQLRIYMIIFKLKEKLKREKNDM